MRVEKFDDYTEEEKIYILETLSDAINICDKSHKYGTGDELLDIIHILKYNWDMEI